MVKLSIRSLGVAASLALVSGAAGAEEAGSLGAAISGGDLIFELRPRVEHVDQTGVDDADAFTNRTRLGWKTAAFHGLTGLVEFEDTRVLVDDYNDGVPPAEPFASVSDPEATELNRLQLEWRANPHVTATLGRQFLQFDDLRFIDPSNSRQDSRTYDAVRVDVSAGSLRGAYVYANQVNNSAADFTDIEGDIHLLNVTNKFADELSLTGFVYALDFNTPSFVNQSTEYIGVRATGTVTALETEFAYALSYAQQQDYGAAIADYDLDYALASLNAKRGVWSSRVQYESLEGDGVRGLFFPIGSGTNFHGWANAFGAKPADGLTDLNISLTYAPRWRTSYLRNVSFTVRHFDFEAERTGADLGDEFDFEIAGAFTEHLSFQLRSGDYEGGALGSPADRRRAWFSLEYKL